MPRIINTAMHKSLTYHFTDKLFPDVIHLQKKLDALMQYCST